MAWSKAKYRDYDSEGMEVPEWVADLRDRQRDQVRELRATRNAQAAALLGALQSRALVGPGPWPYAPFYAAWREEVEGRIADGERRYRKSWVKRELGRLGLEVVGSRREIRAYGYDERHKCEVYIGIGKWLDTREIRRVTI